jgi:hypothetical protein
VGTESIRWRCARCKVSVGQIDGHATSLPANWTLYQESYYCLSCRRAIAGETAVESASPGSSHDDLARLRRSAVIEFEIDRQPEATDRTIAQACRTSRSVVGRVRDELPHGAESEMATSGDG